MGTTNTRREVRSERERELAFRERQARRAARHNQNAGQAIPRSEPFPRAGRRQPPPPVALVTPRSRRPDSQPRSGLILVPLLVLLSLAALALSGYALSRESTSAELQPRVAALSATLTRAEHRLGALQRGLSHSAQASNVATVSQSLRGLRKTVGGVQNAILPLQAQVNALKACLPQLQQELVGIAARPGRHAATHVGLSPACSALLRG